MEGGGGVLFPNWTCWWRCRELLFFVTQSVTKKELLKYIIRSHPLIFFFFLISWKLNPIYNCRIWPSGWLLFYGIHYPINYAHKQIETWNSRCIIFSPSVWLLTLTLFSLGNPFLSFLFLVLSKQFWRLSICTTHSPRSSWHLKHHSMSYEQLQKMRPT